MNIKPSASERSSVEALMTRSPCELSPAIGQRRNQEVLARAASGARAGMGRVSYRCLISNDPWRARNTFSLYAKPTQEASVRGPPVHRPAVYGAGRLLLPRGR